jgi:hypothetical protein
MTAEEAAVPADHETVTEPSPLPMPSIVVGFSAVGAT